MNGKLHGVLQTTAPGLHGKSKHSSGRTCMMFLLTKLSGWMLRLPIGMMI